VFGRCWVTYGLKIMLCYSVWIGRLKRGTIWVNVPTNLRKHYINTSLKDRTEQEIKNIKNVSETLKTKYNKNRFIIIYLSDNLETDFVKDTSNRIIFITPLKH